MQLRPLAWRQLADCAKLPTQSEAFLAALSEYLLQGLDLCQLQVPCDGPPSACIALCRDPGAIAPWRMAGDDELFEPFDALCRTGEGATMLADRLLSLGRAIEFSRIPAHSSLVGAIRARMAGKGLMWLSEATSAPHLPLDETWITPEDHFNSRRRSDFRRARRRAEEIGELTFAMLAPSPDEFDPLFDQAIAVEARSWKTDAGSAIACDPRKEAFFRSYLKTMCMQRQCRVALMRIDGQPVAMQLAIVWDDRYWLYKIGFDEAYGRCSPGNLLMLHAVGEAARAGLRAVEFMGEAEPWIADLWTNQQHEFVRLRVYPLAPAAIAALARDALAWLAARLRRRRS